MRIDSSFLKSKVARRIVLLFVCCALVPIAALGFFSFNYVVKQLYDQTQRRIRQESKAMGMAILERLFFLETEMKLIASNVEGKPAGSISTGFKEYDERLRQRFMGIALVTEPERQSPLFGNLKVTADLTQEQREHLASGKSVVLTHRDRNNRLTIYMTGALDPDDLDRGVLWAVINPMYLWGVEEYGALPGRTELCVLDVAGNVIYSSVPVTPSLSEKLESEIGRFSTGRFQWENEGKTYLASYWSAFMKYTFFNSHWTVVLSASKGDILAPIASFKKIFPLVLLLSFWLVLLLSAVQVRRSLVPLQKLKEQTRRIARKEFDSRVVLPNKDEFGDLAVAFNTMATRLGTQFSALNTMADIDRAVLSSLKPQEIVRTVLAGAKGLFGPGFASVTLVDSNRPNRARTYVLDEESGEAKTAFTTELTSEDTQRLSANRELLTARADEGFPSYLAPFAASGIKSFCVLPIFLKDNLAGMITLGDDDSREHHDDNVIHARQIADQVAVALSNARLIRELDQLNWGTLTALARAVDAKSPWTAGHSERVTNLALQIGQELGFPEKEIENLRRGGLLHDVGKIGVPALILDKPGVLTTEEMRIIREHPRTGARILEPIKAYTHVLHMVRQHHECFDGTGYPDGLSGEEIGLGARVLAVADVFDAVASDRPYRAAMPLDRALELITEGKGKQFDPRVVDAFLRFMQRQVQAGREPEIANLSLAASPTG